MTGSPRAVAGPTGCASPSRPRSSRTAASASRTPPTFPPKPKPLLQEEQFDVTVAALEDKILQRAVVEVLNAVYEADFLGFSYGFRPGRSPHDALDALAVGITRKVNWVLDADFRDSSPALTIAGWSGLLSTESRIGGSCA